MWWITYLKGLGVIVGTIGWIVLFNWMWWKTTTQKLWEQGPETGLLLPIIVPVVIAIILLLPYFIGHDLGF